MAGEQQMTTVQERHPYTTRPWIAAYCAGAFAWALIAGLLGWVVVVGLLVFGVLCGSAAARGLDAGGDQ